MTQTDAVMTHLNRIKEQVGNFPLKCRLFLSLLLLDTLCTHQIQIPKSFKKNFEPFLHIFKNFSPEQKTHLICELSDHVQRYLRGLPMEAKILINQIESSCQMKLDMMGFSFWQRRNFKYSYQERLVKLFTSKKEDVLQLNNYLIRKSQSQRNALVLEPLNSQSTQKLAKITLKFNNYSIMSEIYANIRAVMVQLEEKKLEGLLSEELKQASIENIKVSNKCNRGFTMLTKKTMTDYFNSKEKDLERLAFHRNHSTIIFNKKNVQIYRSKQNKQYFFLEQNLQGPNLNSLKHKIMILNEGVRQTGYSCEILQSFTHNILANYYKIQLGQQQYQFIAVVQKAQKQQTFCQIIKGINNFSLGISIQFGQLILKKSGQNKYSLELNVWLNLHGNKKRHSILKAINLLKEMVKQNQKQPANHINNTICHDGRELFQQPSLQADKSQIEHLDISLGDTHLGAHEGSFVGNSDQKSISLQQSSDQHKNQPQDEIFVTIANFQECEELCIQSFEDKLSAAYFQEANIPSQAQNSNKSYLKAQKKTLQASFLNVKAFNQPLKNVNLKKLKGHFLFGDWQRSSKGGVICVNEEIVNKQKKVLRLLIARLGNSIFNGNGIMNVSLPVQLFKNESQLVSIARNFTYAPILVQPTASFSALQRMKNTILFGISVNTLSLSTQKPFNPLLGQTYQGSINGCPIYLEQTSHHPPISSIYMAGRGYKIYGSICVEIHLKLNHVKGINTHPIIIQYDNGDKIEFNVPVMMINGLLIGERSIYFDGTVYFTDEKNLLIASVQYNVNSKRGIFSFRSQSPDYFSAQIYQVSQTFMQKFIASNKTLLPKKDQSSKIIANISGQWNGKIYFNDQLVFNFQSDLPVELQNFNHPLPSDSTFRKDILALGRGDVSFAQQEKDRSQINQRREKKLRVDFKDPKRKK